VSETKFHTHTKQEKQLKVAATAHSSSGIYFFNCIRCVSGEQTLLEEHVALSLNKLCSDVHHTTFQVIFAPISVQLEQVQSAPAWSNINKQATSIAADLPDFSFVPQEYITQVS
jgi:hypothetical protein